MGWFRANLINKLSFLWKEYLLIITMLEVNPLIFFFKICISQLYLIKTCIGIVPLFYIIMPSSSISVAQNWISSLKAMPFVGRAYFHSTEEQGLRQTMQQYVKLLLRHGVCYTGSFPIGQINHAVKSDSNEAGTGILFTGEG